MKQTLLCLGMLLCLTSTNIYSQANSTNSGNSALRIAYHYDGGNEIDNIFISFLNDQLATTDQYGAYDAISWNSDNYIASYKGIWKCAIQTRPLNFISDTVKLMVASTSTGSFKLTFTEFENFTEAGEIILADNYLGTQTNVKTNPAYSFAITADPNSQGEGRFKMIFKAAPLSCPHNIIVNTAPGQNGANVSYTAKTISTCNSPVVNYNPASGSFFPVGVTTVNVNANVCGSSISCSFTITVKDKEAPVINCPAGITHTADIHKASYSFIPTNPVATDNVSATVTGIRNDGQPLNAPYLVGVTIITWTATDGSGNTVSCNQSVTVTDNELPSITASNINYSANSLSCKYSVGGTALDAVYTDNCPNATVVNSYNNSSTLDGEELPVGITTITWTITDASGNAASCQSVITIVKGITVAIPNANVLATGTNSNTIYLGYAPASQLTYNAQSGGGQISYQWSTAAGLSIVSASNQQTVRVEGNSTSTLFLIATNQFGCSETATRTISVVDIRCGNKKVSVCQKTGNGFSTVCTPENSIKQLLANGGTLGNCLSGKSASTPQTANVEEIKAYPNPANGVFQLQLTGYNGKVLIQVVDMFGKLITSKTITVTSRSEEVNFDLKQHAAGVYNIRIVNEDGVKTTRIVLAQ